jgi:tetratricopeptide (TPR) repeat protein
VFTRLKVELSQLVRHPRRLLAAGVLLLLIGLGGFVAGRAVWAEFTFRSHFEAAQDALKHYHPEEALEHLQACLKLQPEHGRTLWLAARAARQADRFEEAEQYLDTCMTYQGDVTVEAITLERALLRAQRGDIEPVLGYCQQQINDHHPDSSLIQEALAQGFIRTFQYRHAGFCLKVWLDREPKNPRALFLRGQVREQNNNYAEASEDFRQVLKIDPENDETRKHLASCLLELKNARSAAWHLERLHRRHKGDLWILVNLARCRHLQGSPQQAEQLLDQVLARAPRLFTALLFRGQVALQIGKTDVAEQCARQAIAVSPFEYEPHFLLYRALNRQGKTSEAEQESVRMKALQADLDRARDIVTKELEQKPNDPDLHYQIGLTMLRIGNPADALRWFHRALKIDPQHRPTHALLAEYYLRIGNVTRSVHHRELARGLVADMSTLSMAGKGSPSPSP